VGGVELMGRPPLPPGTRTIDSHGYVREKQPNHAARVRGW